MNVVTTTKAPSKVVKLVKLTTKHITDRYDYDGQEFYALWGAVLGEVHGAWYLNWVPHPKKAAEQLALLGQLANETGLWIGDTADWPLSMPRITNGFSLDPRGHNPEPDDAALVLVPLATWKKRYQAVSREPNQYKSDKWSSYFDLSCDPYLRAGGCERDIEPLQPVGRDHSFTKAIEAAEGRIAKAGHRIVRPWTPEKTGLYLCKDCAEHT